MNSDLVWQILPEVEMWPADERLLGHYGEGTDARVGWIFRKIQRKLDPLGKAVRGGIVGSDAGVLGVKVGLIDTPRRSWSCRSCRVAIREL